MCDQLNKLDIQGVVVIGEGECDEVLMFYIGEEVGKGIGLVVDIVLDLLEGIILIVKDMLNVLIVIVMGLCGIMLYVLDVYMDKLVIGFGYKQGVVIMDMMLFEWVLVLVVVKGCLIEDIIVCVLECLCYDVMIVELCSIGVVICLIIDGDVVGVMYCVELEQIGIDMYMGFGGVFEGVLVVVVLKCMGGQFFGKLLFCNEDEKECVCKVGIINFDCVYICDDLVISDVIFVVIGVIDGSLLFGIKCEVGYLIVEIILM